MYEPIRAAVILATLSFALQASSADPAEKAAAEAKFREAKALMEQGKYAEACPKLEESQKLEPSSGTLLRLGYCLEQLGRYASAWALYRQALPEVKAAGNTQRIQFANERIAIVEPKLSRITIVLPPALATAKVELDGKPFAAGNDLPIDGGSHTLTVTASGQAPWMTTFEIATESGRKTVLVPAPATAAATTPTEAPAASSPAPSPASSPLPTRTTPQPPSAAPAIVAFSAAGLFAVGFVVSYVEANHAQADLTRACADEYTITCGLDDKKSTVRRWEALSWVSAGLGAVSATVGVVLLVQRSAGGHESTALTLSPAVGGLALAGRF